MIQTAQLILALSILIVLHELGHFIPAKLFKMRVNKFYLFFDPYFSLLKFKKGDTEYGIGWLPLGGYVKIAGMVDESMDKDQMALPPQPWEFRAKPAWQRLITMLGGVTVNIILAYGIFSMSLYTWGENYLPLENLKQGVYADPILRGIGFQNGDKITKIGDKKVTKETTFQEASWAVLMREVETITVDRNGKEAIVSLPEDIDALLMANKTPRLFEIPFPFVVDSVIPNQNAYVAGFKKGDRINDINGTYIASFYHGQDIIKSNKGKFIDVTVDRFGTKKTIKTYVSNAGMIGIAPHGYWPNLVKLENREFGFGASLIKGFSMTKDMFIKTVSQIKLLFNRNGPQHLRSVISMRSRFGDVWIWQRFWLMTGSISLLLAFFNLLPIPGLDGGHALFTIVEIVSGKKPSQKFMEITQTIGMVLLLSLTLFALGNDIFNPS